MATINGFTAERMQTIENSTIVDGDVVGDNLVLKRRDGGEIVAGNVRGGTGLTGPPGEVEEAPVNGQAYARKNGLWVPTTDDAPADGQTYERKDNAWVSSQDKTLLLANSSLDLAWTPGLSWASSISSLKAVRIGPMVFAFAEFLIATTTSAGLTINLPVPAVPWRNVGTLTSFGLSTLGTAIGTFRANGGGATSATFIHSDGGSTADANSGDRVSVSLIYPA